MNRRAKSRIYNAKYREANRAALRLKQNAARRALRREALTRYGAACARCGFDDERALQIDHVDDNGAAERRALGGQQCSGWRFYHWLKKQGWPVGYQTLCANCNAIKQVERLMRTVGGAESSQPCHG